jgi:hypothetical protein
MTQWQRRRRGARGDERGFVAAELALGVGLLLFPVALLVLTLPTWSERQATGRAIAREVARTVAVEGTCDQAAANDVVRTMAGNLGLDPADVSVALNCTSGSPLPRGGSLTASVTVLIPAVAIPTIAQVGQRHWTTRHTEAIDPYRSFEP